MTIPGRGDLSPRRRSSYGRRRRQWPRVLLVLVVLGALGAGGYYGWQRWSDDDTATVSATSTSPCPSTLPSSLPSPPPGLRPVRVLNGSLHAGLAARVAREMHRRFNLPILRVGNAARFVRGPSLVRYPSRLAADARHVTAMIVPAPRLVVDDSLAHVELDIGTRYRRLASPLEFKRANLGALIAGATRAPSASSSPCPAP